MNLIKNKVIRLNKKTLEALFDKSTHQYEVIEGIYKMVFPDWDDIQLIHGWPDVSKEASLYIFGKFMEFDKKHHPDVINSGLWMNSGFSSSSQRENGWEVDLSKVRVDYKQPEAVMQP